MDPNAIHVLIADKRPAARARLVAMISPGSGAEVIGEVEDGAAAVTAYLALLPEVVILGMTMPTMSAVETIQAIRTHDPTARLIVLVTEDDDPHAALEAGARAVLSAQATRDEVFAVIRAVFGAGT